ncbi:MAG: 50S ribosomal protein L16 [Parcubacteria group bacterium GW2011_GWA2_47_7]|nr:MAG: 50S ribosomal protein L16 [Parcubacteria group bacterium GW2011_GWA2_47_7]
MLFPKKVKHRKWQSNRWNRKKNPVESRGTTLAYGSYGLKAESESRISSNQIEAARRVLSRNVGKTGRVWIRVFPDIPFTQKGAEVPMGKGKGDPKGFVAQILPGRIIFEIDGVTFAQAKEAIRKAGSKVSVRSRMVSRNIA